MVTVAFVTMKKTVIVLLFTGVLITAGCGGSMVGEDAPTYPVPPLLKETTNKVVFSGAVTCQDNQQRDVTLTIQITDRNSNGAQFTIVLDDGTVETGTVTGKFKEGNNRTVLVYSETPITVKYGQNPENNNNPYSNQLIFDNAVYTTTLIYSGDPSVTEVQMNPPAQTICHLTWTDGEGEEQKKPVSFYTLRTE